MRPPESIPVWVVAERRTLDHPWLPESLRPVQVEVGQPLAEPWTVLAEGPGWTRYIAGRTELLLFPSDAANYKFNLDAAAPAIYVIMRKSHGPLGLDLLTVTVDPGEIDSHADSGDDLIEALPLPPDIAAWMAVFVALHYREETHHKRRRDRADPEALARRPPEQRHG